MRNLVRHEFDRILIIKPSSFGDVIHALPILHGLRCRYPRSRISWLVSTACAALLEGHAELDEVIRFDRKRYGLVGRRLPVTVEFVEFLAGLRKRRFDLVLDLQGLFRSGFMALASGARYRIGFASAREFGWLFYSDRVPASSDDTHAVDRNYRFAVPLGFGDVPVTFPVHVDPQARSAILRALATHGLAEGGPYALIVPGTRWETKIWPVDHFAEVARAVRDDLGLPVVIGGAPDEVAIARQLAERVGGKTINLAGRTSVAEMVALAAGASIAVMNDTGPMHLTIALGKPIVTIFGPTSPVRTGPYRRPESVIRLDLPCSPCYLKRLGDCPYQHRCMKDLQPRLVIERISAILSTGALSSCDC